MVYEINDEHYEERIEEAIFEDTFMRAFQYLLKREMRGVTESELSKMTGISVVTISQYRNGKKIPNVRNLRKIAHVLGCTPDDLIWADEDEMLRLEELHTSY